MQKAVSSDDKNCIIGFDFDSRRYSRVIKFLEQN